MLEEDSCQSGEIPLDPAVTPELFMAWRAPRLGVAHPERMNNPVWEWLVRSRVDAYRATQLYSGPSAMEAGPGWCFVRFGQSSTTLPDGRVLWIAGEHEDHYDPDFNIYNDVVVTHPDGRIEIFGYPREVFPATDFHSATLVEKSIVLIGSLGYPHERKPGTTQLLVLDLQSFTITEESATGDAPGWIFEHSAVLADDGSSILVRGGKVDRGGESWGLVENIDDWRLHLRDWRWERLTERRWQRWAVRRCDGASNHLWEFEQEFWHREIKELKTAAELLTGLDSEDFPSLAEKLGISPDLDLYARRYQPELPHERLVNADTPYGVHRIKVGDVTVRYVEDMYGIQMTVEGELDPSIADALARDLRDKLSSLENTAYELLPL